MTLQLLPMTFAVCKLPEDAGIAASLPFCFFARTEDEVSLVCPEERIPPNALRAERGWRCLRVQGPLEFGLVGILAKIAGCLAIAQVPLFAVSTYDTDYVLVKAEHLERGRAALTATGMTVR